jgi:cytochrome c peroxidase
MSARVRGRVAWLAFAAVVGACADQSPSALDVPSGDPARFVWRLPPGFPMPAVPADNAMSDAARRGEALFRGDRLKCAACHAGEFFTTFVATREAPQPDVAFVNNGLYNIDGKGTYPEPNTGMYAFSRVVTDMGRFKVPSLRNVAVTFPYMHDGSLGSLSDVVDHYAAGGRTIPSGAHAGDGSRNPYKSPLVAGFAITPAEKADLIAFLESLTDSTFLRDTRLTNPWIKNP